ncbi:MAG TPA: ATP-binding protein [Chloroflexota bacterium]
MTRRVLPLRWRLTLLYAGILALFLIVLDIFVYTQLQRALLQGQQAVLTANVNTLMDLLNTEGVPNGAALGRRLSPGVVFQLDDPQGAALTASSGPREEFPALPAPTPFATPSGPPPGRLFGGRPGPPPRAAGSVATVQVQGADGPESWLVLTLPVGSRGHPPAILRVASSLASVQGTLLDLIRILGGGSLGVIVLALVSGPAVAARALRPLGRMAGTAEQLASGDLSRRTALRHGNDEVGHLARSLDDMAARLEQSFAEQQATEARLRRFAADASHELRTPLTALRGYVEVLLRGARDDPEDAGRALEAMQREALRMEHLTRDLLDLTRLDAGLAGEQVPVRLDVLVEQLLMDLPPPAVPARWGRHEAVSVAGDGPALRRAAGNLLENARRYSPDGSPVEVAVWLEDSQAVLSVRDAGTGIAPEDLPHIFERFYRGDSARSRATGGSGLGLSIVQAIVEAHGGTVAATSQPGHGSTFTVRLPALQPALPLLAVSSIAAPDERGLPSGSGVG